MSVGNTFFKSAFSVDNVIFGFDDSLLKILLIKRAERPYKDQWALPGDLVFPEEHLDDAPKRVLRELTGLENVFLEQVATFGRVDRHPLGRVITVAYYSLVNIAKVHPKPHSFAEELAWHEVSEIKSLAFDHMLIMKKCLDRLKSKVRTQPIGFELLPQKFTLSELQDLYEAVLGKPLDKRNFRKKILSLGVLLDQEEYQTGVAHRPAKLFQFDRKRYAEAKSLGLTFEV